MSDQTAPKPWIFWLSLAQLISWGSTIYWFPLLMPEIEASLGLTRAQSSIGISLALLSEGVCGYFIGRLIDQGHARIVMSCGSLWVGLCLCLHSTVSSVWQFYVLWCCIGAGLSTVLYTPLFAVATRRFPNDFRRAIITITFLGGLASTAFIPLSAWLVHHLDWQRTCLVLGACQLLICLPIHWLFLSNEPTPSDLAIQSKKSLANDSSVLPATTIQLSELLGSRSFIALGFFMMLGLSVSAAIPPHLVSLLRERGLSEAWAIGIPALIGVLQVAGRAVILWMDGKFDENKVNRAIVLLMPIAIGLLMLPFTSPWLALAFAGIFGIANGSLTIVKGTAIARYVNRERVASLNGILSLPIAISRASAPFIVGLLWSPVWGYKMGVFFMFAASALAYIAFLYGQKNRLI